MRYYYPFICKETILVIVTSGKMGQDGNANGLAHSLMATHSSVFACRIPGMGEPGGLASMASYRVGHV